mmetsp:Transcript_21048/g.29083  ORF Transcript_21048/g.29083 Transcript_21048/m.29083 type:complete len:151 (-) Transcript_21048:228-680(-)
MSNSLAVLVKKASNLRDEDGIGQGGSDAYVKARIVDSDGNTVAGPMETSVKNDDSDPEWMEELLFEGLETPGAYTLKLNVLDKDSVLGIGGEIADCLAADDKLGSADVDLGTLANSEDFQDQELVIERRFFGACKSTLSIALSTKGGWGN